MVSDTLEKSVAKTVRQDDTAILLSTPVPGKLVFAVRVGPEAVEG